MPKPKTIYDPQGLGIKFPFENVGTIAGDIGGAALTGGSAAAGDALLMEGTTGLMNAGRAGASVGTGVAAGASASLGHSDIANVVSGIIHGIRERSVGRVLHNRRLQNAINQQIPLLQETGNRLGWREGESRLVANIHVK